MNSEGDYIRGKTQYSAETGRIIPPSSKHQRSRSCPSSLLAPQPLQDQELMVNKIRIKNKNYSVHSRWKFTLRNVFLHTWEMCCRSKAVSWRGGNPVVHAASLLRTSHWLQRPSCGCHLNIYVAFKLAWATVWSLIPCGQVLEILCQILQTDSLSIVQQWLLLAGQRGKTHWDGTTAIVHYIWLWSHSKTRYRGIFI